jgi:capsular polysaccharide export protein
VTRNKTFLFLQGHPSSFQRRLADALEAAGARVVRINFCVGDWVYWLGRRAVNYRGSLGEWANYLEAFIAEEGVTDILYYGDRRPYHRIAADVARRAGVRAMTYEFGYLRPDWLTLERGGMSTWSHFPVEPGMIRAIGTGMEAADLTARYRHGMAVELFHEVFYNLSSYFLWFVFPRYDSDRYYDPLVEYMTGIPRQLRLSANARRAGAEMQRLWQAKTRYFLFPLQLQNDYQLRANAPFPHQGNAIAEVVGSFARHAPRAAHLVFKCHPLDNGGEGWPGHIMRAAEAAGVAQRVHYIDGGNLEAILDKADGCVLINSTVGLHAIARGCPVKVLGGAVFDIEGVADQCPLDQFWSEPQKPDPGLADAFVRALAGTVQVKGNFFSRKGQAAAIPVFVDRLMAEEVNGKGAFVDPPPRLAD